MRHLFDIDKKDYNPNGTSTIRPSVRGIIIKRHKIAMIHSLKYDYYKFPGGGAENGESHIDTLVREIMEESGLTVIKNTVREYGCVHRVQKGHKEDMFIQDNYYYICDVEEKTGIQKLDDYENEEQFTLEWVLPETVIDTNKNHFHGKKQEDFQFEAMAERECRVMKMLINERLI